VAEIHNAASDNPLLHPIVLQMEVSDCTPADQVPQMELAIPNVPAVQVFVTSSRPNVI